MKSRVAVSLLFILIAATFMDVTGAFKKFRLWAGRGCDRHVVKVESPTANPNSAPAAAIQGVEGGITIVHLDGVRLLLSENCATRSQPCVVGTISPDGKTITLSALGGAELVNSPAGRMQNLVFKLASSDSGTGSFEFITTAARKVREAVELIRGR